MRSARCALRRELKHPSMCKTSLLPLVRHRPGCWFSQSTAGTFYPRFREATVPLQMTETQAQRLIGGAKALPRRKRAPGAKAPRPVATSLPIARGRVRLHVPVPITANLMWRVFDGVVVKSSAYRAWEAKAQAAVPQADRALFVTPVCVLVTIQGGKLFRTSRDIDNCTKPCVDLVKRCGFVIDDNVRFVTWSASRYIEAARVRVPARCWVDVVPVSEWIQFLIEISIEGETI